MSVYCEWIVISCWFREHCEFLEMQLDSERNRNSQLESTVEQLHLQIGDYAVQMNELQRELGALVKSYVFNCYYSRNSNNINSV